MNWRETLKVRRGQSLVEMALVLPPLILVLLSLCEFGWYFYYLATINNACRLGARVGAMGTAGTNNDAAISTTISTAMGSLANSE